MQYIMQIPQMALILREHETEAMEYCIVSFAMSLEAFMKYNKENFVVDEFCVGRKSVHAKVEELEVVPDASDNELSESDVDEDYYYDLISNMYKVAQDIAKEGNQGASLPIPIVDTRTTCASCDGYVQEQFKLLETGEIVSRWLVKEEAISNQGKFLPIMYLFIVNGLLAFVYVEKLSCLHAVLHESRISVCR
jgi:hypothetical protein